MSQPPADPAPVTAAKPPGPDEVVFYQGSPKLRGELGLVFKSLAAALVFVAIGVACTIYQRPVDWYWLVLLICCAVALGVLLLPSLLVKRDRYRISNYRIDFEHGLVSKHLDTIELWHVEDVSMRMGLADRVLGVGTITVESDDRSTPKLLLRSLPNPRVIFEQLKTRVLAVKRQRGVIKLDS